MQKHNDATLVQFQTVPLGLSYWVIRNMFSWIKTVCAAMGTDDPELWGETFRCTLVDGKGEEVNTVWKMTMHGKFDILCNWLDLYLVVMTLGICGGPLNKTRGYLLDKIMGFLRDPFKVLEADELMRMWDVFYVIPEEVAQDENEVLRFALEKAMSASEGNMETERHYMWAFQEANRLDLLKTFLGFMIEKENHWLPLKDERPERSSIAVPTLVLEGESSKGLDWRRADSIKVQDENRLHVDWRPALRQRQDIDEMNALPLVEESVTFREDEDASRTLALEEVVAKPGTIRRPGSA